jgi:hypothetical protein
MLCLFVEFSDAPLQHKFFFMNFYEIYIIHFYKFMNLSYECATRKENTKSMWLEVVSGES